MTGKALLLACCTGKLHWVTRKLRFAKRKKLRLQVQERVRDMQPILPFPGVCVSQCPPMTCHARLTLFSHSHLNFLIGLDYHHLRSDGTPTR